MNATECYERILDAAESWFADRGIQSRADQTAIRMFRARTYKMKSRLAAARTAARAIRNGTRPPCLR